MNKIVTLPLPNSKLSPNSRTHWRAKSKLVKEHRRNASLYASHQLELQRFKIKGYKLRFHWRDRRRHDRDNAAASCKSYLDGLADFLQQDDSEWEFYGVEFGEPDKARPRVEIILTVLDGHK